MALVTAIFAAVPVVMKFLVGREEFLPLLLSSLFWWLKEGGQFCRDVTKIQRTDGESKARGKKWKSQRKADLIVVLARDMLRGDG